MFMAGSEGFTFSPEEYKWSPEFHDMIFQCLQLDPTKRPTSFDLLQVTFFFLFFFFVSFFFFVFCFFKFHFFNFNYPAPLPKESSHSQTDANHYACHLFIQHNDQTRPFVTWSLAVNLGVFGNSLVVCIRNFFKFVK
jgi:hypothetical protein